MLPVTRRPADGRRFCVFNLAVLLCACDSAQDPDVSETSSAGSETSDTDAWPQCEPMTLPRFRFALSASAEELPEGELTRASCAFGSLEAVELPAQPPQILVSAWEHTLVLTDCVDRQGQPFDAPLNAAFVTSEVVALARWTPATRSRLRSVA